MAHRYGKDPSLTTGTEQMALTLQNATAARADRISQAMNQLTEISAEQASELLACFHTLCPDAANLITVLRQNEASEKKNPYSFLMLLDGLHELASNVGIEGMSRPHKDALADAEFRIDHACRFDDDSDDYRPEYDDQAIRNAGRALKQAVLETVKPPRDLTKSENITR